jgi:hypothetical protein
MSLTRRQLDFRMKLAKEFAATPSGKPVHESSNSLYKKESTRKKFLQNPKNLKPKGETPL